MDQSLCSNRSCNLRHGCLRYLGHPRDDAQQYADHSKRQKLRTGECAGWISVKGLDPRQYRDLRVADFAMVRMETAKVVEEVE